MALVLFTCSLRFFIFYIFLIVHLRGYMDVVVLKPVLLLAAP